MTSSISAISSGAISSGAASKAEASIGAVQSRIAQLRTLLSVGPAGLGAGAAGGAAAGSSSSSDFATALQNAFGGGAGLSDVNGLSDSSGLAGLDGFSGGSGTSADLGAQAVSTATAYTGVPYRWGGTNPATGLDCSGLTQLVYGKLGITLPRVAADQAKVGTGVASIADAQPGDLVFFGSPATHVGIYVGDGKMIDAPKTGATVGVHPLWSTPSSIRRVTGGASTGSAALGVSANSTGGALGGPYASLFTAAGAKYGIDPALLSAVAKAESAYNPRAVSSAGAGGLMQLMPATARSLGVDAYNPAQAVDGAARLLKGMLGDFGGRVDLALAGYNAGAGAVKRYGGVPPYAETQTYVKRVTQNWKALR